MKKIFKSSLFFLYSSFVYIDMSYDILKMFISSKLWVLDKKLTPPLALKLFDNWLGAHFHDIFHFLN